MADGNTAARRHRRARPPGLALSRTTELLSLTVGSRRSGAVRPEAGHRRGRANAERFLRRFLEPPRFHSFHYMDLLLPVVNFKQRDAYVAEGWAAWAVFGFTFAGWLLAAIVVAGLSGVSSGTEPPAAVRLLRWSFWLPITLRYARGGWLCASGMRTTDPCRWGSGKQLEPH
jgi:hypothetical protein